jgi:hypothetical protein
MQRLMTSALKLDFRTKLEAAKTQTDLTESLSCEIEVHPSVKN